MNYLFCLKLNYELHYKKTPIPKHLFLRKYDILRESCKENSLLKDVFDDYEKSLNDIVGEKHKQYNALQILSTHLDDLIMNAQLSQNAVEEGLQDQKDILKKMQSIKNDLDEITNITESKVEEQ